MKGDLRAALILGVTLIAASAWASCTNVSDLAGTASDAGVDGAPPDVAEATSDVAASEEEDSGGPASDAADGTHDGGVDATPDTGGDGTDGSSDAGADATHDGNEDAGSDAPSEAPVDSPNFPSIFNVQANASNTAGAAQGSVQFGAVMPGDAIVVCVDYDDPTLTVVSVTDTLGNNYVPVVGAVLNNGVEHFVFLAQNTPSGVDSSIVVALSGSTASSLEVYAFEFTGLATSNAFDTASWLSGTSTAQDGMISGPKTTSAAHELILGYGETGSAAPGTGFTPISGFDGNVVEMEEVFAMGSYQATATMTSGGSWTMIMATFRGQ